VASMTQAPTTFKPITVSGLETLHLPSIDC
jgi:hypothetical protein